MAICEWVFEVPESDSNKTVTKQDMSDISLITLSEFEQRDMAVEIYSEVLRCTLWLSSDNAMADQIKEEAPGAVCYTVSELRLLINLKPGPESLKKIHEAKVINPGSIIKDAITKEDTGVLEGLYE
jgi:hypothetical protein